MTDLKIGDRFVVNSTEEIRTPKGRLLARYLPGFDYRVTPRNLELVAGMIAAGKAKIGTTTPEEKLAAATGGMDVKAGTGRVSGFAKTGKEN